MVNEVNKIIYNRLITERVVTLPGVGSLSLVRHAASMLSRDVVAAPKLTVEFSTQAAGGSIVDTIAIAGNVDVNMAEDIYSRWLEKVRSGSTLTIEGVGVLRNKSFEVDRELSALLNGAGATQINVVRNKMNRTVLWMMLILSVITTVISLAVIFKDDISAMLNKCSSDDVEQAETTIEETSENTVEEDVVTDDVIKVLADVATEEEIVEESIEVAVTDDSWTTRRDIRHWVVAGSYSTEDNAESAVAAIEKKYPDVDCQIISLGKMYAVALYGSSDRDECAQYMRKHRENFGEVWIFTPTEYR